jgi:soluble lytic murein transglycosylase-like protein
MSNSARRGTDPTPENGNADEKRVDRRRAEDHEGAPAEGRRKQDFFQKYRQPLVGLGLIGAAVPLVNAQQNPAVAKEHPVEPETEQAPASAEAAAVAKTNDAEETLVSKIADTRETEARTTQVQSAMSKYGISEEMATDIYDIARQEGVEPEVAYGLVHTESTFKETAVSGVGARGLTQLMPKTAKWLMPGTSAQDLFNRKTSLKLGFRYLTQLTNRYRGNLKLALLAYNRGPGTVDRVLKKGGNPDNGYASKVLGG